MLGSHRHDRMLASRDLVRMVSNYCAINLRWLTNGLVSLLVGRLLDCARTSLILVLLIDHGQCAIRISAFVPLCAADLVAIAVDYSEGH